MMGDGWKLWAGDLLVQVEDALKSWPGRSFVNC
jgi:hypothetical protein